RETASWRDWPSRLLPSEPLVLGIGGRSESQGLTGCRKSSATRSPRARRIPGTSARLVERQESDPHAATGQPEELETATGAGVRDMSGLRASRGSVQARDSPPLVPQRLPRAVAEVTPHPSAASRAGEAPRSLHRIHKSPPRRSPKAHARE